jgi:hypothetical protein
VNRDLLAAHDRVESVKTRLESFLHAFERLATTGEQKQLVEAFREFVQDVNSVGVRSFFDRLWKKQDVEIDIEKIVHGEGKIPPPEPRKGMRM